MERVAGHVTIVNVRDEGACLDLSLQINGNVAEREGGNAIVAIE